MSRQGAITRAAAYFDDGSFIRDLTRRVAIKTESQIPASHPFLRTYLTDEIAPCLVRMGYKTKIFDNPVKGGGPFLHAERIEDAKAPTVLTYGHGDVIRGLEGQWKNNLSPWTLTKDGDRYYGRGSADNKAQHSINMTALEMVIAERGRLGFNSKIMIDTSEEIGSPGLHEYCAQHRDMLKADLLIGSDGPRLAPQRPTIYMGTRGALNFDLIVDLREGGHHSGNWGGLLANPGVILAHAITSIIDAKGKVLARDIVPDRIPNSVRAALADAEIDPGADGPTIDAWWGEPGLTAPEKVFAWNTFEVLAMVTGNPDRPVNAVPPRAKARCQIRFTVDKKPETFLPALQRHLDRHGFGVVKVQASPEDVVMNATRLDPDHPAVRWAAKSVETTMGAPPAVLPNLGGSLPNDCFTDILGMPTIWVPHSYASCSQHAPNEHVLAPILREGLQIMTGIFWDMGESPPKLQ
ncbi:MAG: M20 family metallopeptidase [Proteobacteria bacterium]|nr:M20 family metallopeptidase [Pseudomonadota bacterium]